MAPKRKATKQLDVRQMLAGRQGPSTAAAAATSADPAPVLQRDWHPLEYPHSHFITELAKELNTACQNTEAAAGASACTAGADVAVVGHVELTRQRVSERAPRPNQRLLDGSCELGPGAPGRAGSGAPGGSAVVNMTALMRDQQAAEAAVLTTLEKVEQVQSDSRCFPQALSVTLAEIVRNKGKHHSAKVILAAFRLLQHQLRRLPLCKVDTSGKLPVLLVNKGCWDPMIWKRPVEVLKAAQEAAYRAMLEPGTRAGGQLGPCLLFRHLVLLLQQDLAARLRVFRAHCGATGVAAHPMLFDSLLWRMFLQFDTHWDQRKALVQLCGKMVVLGAQEPPCAAPPAQPLVGRSELAGSARTLLSLFFELYTTTEGCGAYYGNSLSVLAMHNTGSKNDRYQMDAAVKDMIMDSACLIELKQVESKQALLLALPPRDCVRLLGLVVAHKHDRRPPHDLQPFDALGPLVHYWNCGGKNIEDFVWPDPVKVLCYLQRDWHWAKQSFFGGLEGLVLLVSCMATACARLPGNGSGQPPIDRVATAAALSALQQRLQQDKQGLRVLAPAVLCHWQLAGAVVAARG